MQIHYSLDISIDLSIFSFALFHYLASFFIHMED